MTTEFLTYRRNDDGSRTVEVIANGNFIIAYYYRGIVSLKSTDARSKRYIDDLELQLEQAVKKYIHFVERGKRRKKKKTGRPRKKSN